MKYICLLILVCTHFTTFGQSYQLKPNTSEIVWTGKAAFNAYTLSGTVAVSSASAQIENGQLRNASIKIDMTTIQSDLKELTKHLKSQDFFDVKQFQQASFSAQQVEQLNSDSIAVSGLLTIKEITKPYSFSCRCQPPTEDEVTIEGVLNVDRTDFDIFYNSPNYFKNLKQNAIADEFTLEIRFALERQNPD